MKNGGFSPLQVGNVVLERKARRRAACEGLAPDVPAFFEGTLSSGLKITLCSLNKIDFG